MICLETSSVVTPKNCFSPRFGILSLRAAGDLDAVCKVRHRAVSLTEPAVLWDVLVATPCAVVHTISVTPSELFKQGNRR